MLNDFEISLTVADDPDGPDGPDGESQDELDRSSVMIKRIPNLSSKLAKEII